MSDHSPSSDQFLTTRWTAVLAASGSQTTIAAKALADLCQSYWYPLYAYVRRRGRTPEDAEDLTQGFFERLLRLNSLADVSRERGKFRAFLLASMNHYLADERAHASAQKRDVNRTVSIDAAAGESRYAIGPVDEMTPERVYERQWALTLLETVVGRLHGEYEASGRGALFLELRFAIACEKGEGCYKAAAERLGQSEESLRVAVHRLRQRYRQILRDEIAQTVADASEIDAELDHLRSVLTARNA